MSVILELQPAVFNIFPGILFCHSNRMSILGVCQPASMDDWVLRKAWRRLCSQLTYRNPTDNWPLSLYPPRTPKPLWLKLRIPLVPGKKNWQEFHSSYVVKSTMHRRSHVHFQTKTSPTFVGPSFLYCFFCFVLVVWILFFADKHGACCGAVPAHVCGQRHRHAMERSHASHGWPAFSSASNVMPIDVLNGDGQVSARIHHRRFCIEMPRCNALLAHWYRNPSQRRQHYLDDEHWCLRADALHLGG